MVADYSGNVNRDLEEMRKKVKNLNALAFHPHRVYKSPNSLRLCAEGREKDTPNSFAVTINSIDKMENRTRVNLLRVQVEDLDWAFLIGVIVSFAAILLTYDAISGEREDGTLRLILSNSIPRATILLGKYLGAAISLLLLFFIALLLNLIIVLTFGVHFTSEQWTEIEIIVLASLSYASAFLTMGLFISSITRNSTTSFVLLLFLWTIFVVIVPGSGGTLAGKIQKVPTQRDLAKQIGAARSQVWAKYPRDIGGWNWDFKPPVPEQIRRRGRWSWDMAVAEDGVKDNYRNKLIRQVRFAEDIMRISPMMVYTFLCEGIAGTGLHRFESFYSQVKKYRNEWQQWLLAEDKKDKDSFHILSNEEWIPPFSRKKIDFGHLPGFSEKPIPIADAIQYGMLDGVLLMLFNLIFFMGAYVAFLQYDVR
jgi:ABC-type transport system involved in multi-copper enzyme maturation permease subunit